MALLVSNGDVSAEALRVLSDAATPGPWFYNSYSGVFSVPLTLRYNELEAAIPADAPDEAYEHLPETQVCTVGHIERGDLGTKQGQADAEYIVALVNGHRAAVAADPKP